MVYLSFVTLLKIITDYLCLFSYIYLLLTYKHHEGCKHPVFNSVLEDSNNYDNNRSLLNLTTQAHCKKFSCIKILSLNVV